MPRNRLRKYALADVVKFNGDLYFVSGCYGDGEGGNAYSLAPVVQAVDGVRESDLEETEFWRLNQLTPGPND